MVGEAAGSSLGSALLREPFAGLKPQARAVVEVVPAIVMRAGATPTRDNRVRERYGAGASLAAMSRAGPCCQKRCCSGP